MSSLLKKPHPRTVSIAGKLRARRGMTLPEVMVVVFIFAFVFGAILVVLLASDTSWKTGQSKLIEQQEARRTADNIVRMLRRTRPEWVTISASGFANRDKILFYEPVVDSNGTMNAGDWIIIKPDASDPRLLIMKDQGVGVWNTIAQKIDGIHFSCGCPGCAAVDSSCPRIKLDIETRDDKGFNLTTCVYLRNNGSGNIGAPPVAPDEGEF